MMPNSMLQPSPMSTTLAFSSRVVWLCSVALILSISALVITVAVVGFPGLGCAKTTRGIRIAAATTSLIVVFLISFLLGGEVYVRREYDGAVKRIGFLSFGHWSESPGSQVRTAADSLIQSLELAVAAEALGADGAYFRVHHFARQLGSPFP